MIVLLVIVLLWTPFFGQSAVLENIGKKKWGNLDVVWIEDNSVPTFSMQVYFSDGALSDRIGIDGETDYMFTGLFWGTNRFNQKEISDNLDYFGVRYSFQVYHEYSTFSVHGLTKDIIPLIKKYCHLFTDSIYPREEVIKYTKRMKSYLGNLVANHSTLASHVFRRLSLRGTDFEYPVAGTLNSIGKIKIKDLLKKRKYFNSQVKKKLYLRGSREILKVKETILGECGWGKPTETYIREVADKQKFDKLKTKIVLIPVKGANQAQIRIGRFLSKKDIQNFELLEVMAEYLGGNFASVLTEELRTKKGLVYSVSAFAQGQKYYGRSIISTFTGNEKVKETLQSIRNSLRDIGSGSISQERLVRTVNFLKGSHLFQFESHDSFLRTLMFYDHLEKDWHSLYQFPQIIDKFSAQDVSTTLQKIFNWEDILVVVIGNPSLLKSLREVDSVQVLNHRQYL